MTHYPERLHRAFIVAGRGNGYVRSKLKAKLSLPSFISSPTTREKIKLLSTLSDLNAYFDFAGCGDFVDGAAQAETTIHGTPIIDECVEGDVGEQDDTSD